MTAPLDDTFGYQSVAPAERQRRIRGVFNAVAGRYDRMNDLMSFGIHRLWKRRFVRALPARGLKAGKARLAVRPNRIDIVKAGTKNALPAKLGKVTYVGKHLECFAETEAGDVFAICGDVDVPFAAGDAVALGFPERGPVLLGD